MAIPGLPGGFIIYQGHLFPLNGHLWTQAFPVLGPFARRLRLPSAGRVELHLVDHWGAPNVPLLRRGRVAAWLGLAHRLAPDPVVGGFFGESALWMEEIRRNPAETP